MLKIHKPYIFYLLSLYLSCHALNANSHAFNVDVAKDTRPDQFTFTDQSNVVLKTKVTSNAITVSGMDANARISVTGGKFSINGGNFINKTTRASNGSTVRVQSTSSSKYNTTTKTVLKIGGVKDTFSVTTRAALADTTPDAFSFTDQTDIALSSEVSSNAVTVNGINVAAPISITGGSYSINGGVYTSAAGTVDKGNSVTVRLTASATNATTSQAILTIGGVPDTFSVTTLAEVADTTPDEFTFNDQFNVALASEITSDTLTVTGLEAASPVSITGGTYSINGGAYTSDKGMVENGSNVSVRLDSSPAYAVTSDATLNIGGASDTFSATTKVTDSGFYQPPASAGNPGFSSEHFLGSANCTLCHNNIKDSNAVDVSIETDWSSTMMANAARDPFWKAKVRSELNRNPQLAEVINDKCTRCHAPMANFEAKSFNEPKALLDGGFLDAAHPRHDEAMNGVSCTLCHQIQDTADLGTLASFTGKYSIGKDKLIYGQYPAPFPNPMIMHTGYTPSYGAHTQSSKLCATCHNLKTPYLDENGTVLSTTPESEFPEQMPYSEWEHSSYADANGKQCQDCHMPHINGVKIANRPPWLAARDNFGKHEFVGANKLMLDIFNTNKTQLGVLSKNFAETIDKTQDMLNQSASITPVSQSIGTDNTLSFTLKIDSKTGHKLPSAFPSRRVILHVTVKDAQNNIVFESGKINANGSVRGVDADRNKATFEPHYELITSPGQVQVYEAIMGDNQNQVTYTLLRGMVYLKDNRLLPLGFDKASAPDDIKVVGNALSDANFIGGSDQISYRISGLSGNSYQVEAELVHQPAAYAFTQDLFTEVDNEVADFKVLFNASNSKSNRIADSHFTVSQ